MIFLAGFFVVTYTVLIAVSAICWLRLPVAKQNRKALPKTRISLIVAVRNEAPNIRNLLQYLELQSYPKNLFEVLVIDDASEDATGEMVLKFSETTDLNLHYFSLKNSTVSGKKAAVAYGVEKASGELIALTDGDCRVQECWLDLLEQEYAAGKVKFISGPVLLSPAIAFFEKLQMVEFASLIGTGAAFIGMGKPTMCNGANLAYEKAAFMAVNGFDGNDKIASGDDEFLMHKINRKFPGQVRFLKNAAATVFTSPIPDLQGFLQQRIRWAGKWKYYRNISSQLIGFMVFGAVIAVIGAGVAALFFGLPGTVFWWLFGLKAAIDFLFLFIVLKFFGRLKYILLFLPLQFVYIPYVLYCALAGLTGKYRWKNRQISSA